MSSCAKVIQLWYCHELALNFELVTDLNSNQHDTFRYSLSDSVLIIGYHATKHVNTIGFLPKNNFLHFIGANVELERLELLDQQCEAWRNY